MNINNFEFTVIAAKVVKILIGVILMIPIILIIYAICLSIILLIRKSKLHKYVSNIKLKRPLAQYTYEGPNIGIKTQTLVNDIDSSINVELLIKELYDKYLDIQEARTNFDNEKLKTLLTNELYNIVINQQKVLQILHKKNIMNSFKYISGFITDLYYDENIEVVKVIIATSFKDYFINEKGNIIDGNKKRIYKSYKLTFVRNIKNKINKCPNCGSPINGNICNFCKTTFLVDHTDWILSNKEIVYYDTRNIVDFKNGYHAFINQKDYSNNQKTIKNYNTLSIKEFKDDKFISMVNNNYIMICTSIMTNSLDTYKNILSKDIYDKLKHKLDELTIKDQIQIYDRLTINSTKIIKGDILDNKYVVHVLLDASYYDYFIDKCSLKPIYGQKISNKRYIYEMVYIKKVDDKNDNIINTCPSCGSNIGYNYICPYCGQAHNNNYWILDNIEIKERL